MAVPDQRSTVRNKVRYSHHFSFLDTAKFSLKSNSLKWASFHFIIRAIEDGIERGRTSTRRRRERKDERRKVGKMVWWFFLTSWFLIHCHFRNQLYWSRSVGPLTVLLIPSLFDPSSILILFFFHCFNFKLLPFLNKDSERIRTSVL